MNTDAPLLLADWPTLADAEQRVLQMQTKLHRWAGEDQERRFSDLYNLVSDPAFLTVAWERVAGNTGARSAGVDGFTAHYIRSLGVAEAFLRDIREQLKAGTFRPLPVRERMIPKPGSVKKRRLGIPTGAANCGAVQAVVGFGAGDAPVPSVGGSPTGCLVFEAVREWPAAGV